MKCYKCQKEMDRENSKPTIKGIEVDVKMNLDPIFLEDMAPSCAMVALCYSSISFYTIQRRETLCPIKIWGIL